MSPHEGTKSILNRYSQLGISLCSEGTDGPEKNYTTKGFCLLHPLRKLPIVSLYDLLIWICHLPNSLRCREDHSSASLHQVRFSREVATNAKRLMELAALRNGCLLPLCMSHQSGLIFFFPISILKQAICFATLLCLRVRVHYLRNHSNTFVEQVLLIPCYKEGLGQTHTERGWCVLCDGSEIPHFLVRSLLTR